MKGSRARELLECARNLVLPAAKPASRNTRLDKKKLDLIVILKSQYGWLVYLLLQGELR